MRDILPAVFRRVIGVGPDSQTRLGIDSALQSLKCVPHQSPKAGTMHLVTEKAQDKRGRNFEQLTLRVNGGNSIARLVEEMNKSHPGALEKIAKLEINDSQAVYLEGIQNFKNLVHLKIESPELISIERVQALKHLRVASFKGCSGLSDIRPLKLTNIQSVNICGTRCNNTSVGALVGIPNLRLINARDTKVTMANCFDVFRAKETTLPEIIGEVRNLYTENFKHRLGITHDRYFSVSSLRVRGVPFAEVTAVKAIVAEYRKRFDKHILKLKAGEPFIATDELMVRRRDSRRIANHLKYQPK